MNKGGVCAGHYDGANVIPAAYRTLPSHNYSEGTTMRALAKQICAEHPAWYDARPETGTGKPFRPDWKERARRLKAAGCTHAFELHTNWSIGSSGKPNRGIFLVIVSLCYEAGVNQAKACAEEKALATKLWKPLALQLGLKFEVRTRKGGGKWDYYSFINECKKRGIAHPMIVEHGYHMDFAEHKAAWMKTIAAYYEKVEAMLGIGGVGGGGGQDSPVYFTTTAQCYTLWAVHKKFKVPWESIRLANGAKPNPYAMRPGIKLRVK